MMRANPNHIDFSRSDAKTGLGVCPLRKAKVQLLPLRYGLVERLDPAAELAMPYQPTSRPLGIRLVRDGWLYVIDNTSGYLHEYRVQSGEVTQFVWQGNEASHNQRQGMDTQHALLFSRSATLHVAYSEVQWTAYKCSKMIDSRAERDHFMQVVDLSTADCVKGGSHLLTPAQAKQWLAEVAEPPANTVPVEGMHAEETQDYVWEDPPLFKNTHMAAVKRQLLAAYEHDHLYLVFNDTLAVMRDLAQEQDAVVSWVDEWVLKERQELKYLVGSYIETLMVLNDKTASSTGVGTTLFEKTTAPQREAIYEYLNARNTLIGLPSSASPEKAYYPGHGFDASTRSVRQTMHDKQQAMHDALGEPLYAELKDPIETLQDHSYAALQGKGLGARGIHDLVRHQEMTAYLDAERVHIKRWTERLDRITEDRTQLFTEGELHRSLWYFDPNIEHQLLAALITEHNCVRDLCRTDESLEAVGEYLHKHPYYILPAFSSRLDLAFLNSKAADLAKWLDENHSAEQNIATAQLRLTQVQQLLGQHWANSLTLSPEAMVNSQLVQAAYSPASALRVERWLVKLQSDLNGPALKAHLDALKTYSNRAQRLAGLMALELEGATLRVASVHDVQQFGATLAKLNVLMTNEDTYRYNRDVLRKDSTRKILSEHQRAEAKVQSDQYHQLLGNTRKERAALVKQLQAGLTITSDQSAGFIGLKLKLNAQQQTYLNDEIYRLRSGVRGGYGEGSAGLTVFKSGWLPLALMLWQAQTLGEAWGEWKKQAGTRGIKEVLILAGAISGMASSAFSVYQSVHIGLVDKAFKSVLLSSGSESGMLLAVKMGKLGLGLGALIAPLAFVGALGTSLNNFNKWTRAIRTGNAGEKAGAFIALTGDTGNTAVTGMQTVKVFKELLPVIASFKYGIKAVSTAWVAGSNRFLIYIARSTPWSLVATALSLGGEAIYNYYNLDDHQRWLAQCCWGHDDQQWSWPEHAQLLAETTLRPVITDGGLTQPSNEFEKVRTLMLSFPGLNRQSLAEHPIRFTALWRQDSTAEFIDVGSYVRDRLCLVGNNPLTLQLNLPYAWCGTQSLLLMRLSVLPELANAPLKLKEKSLNYRIPLDLGTTSPPIKGVVDVASISNEKVYELKMEHLNE